jgi:hypothetical protein
MKEKLLSNCCGAPVLNPYHGTAFCTKCKEMCEVITEEGYDVILPDGPEEPDPYDEVIDNKLNEEE